MGLQVEGHDLVTELQQQDIRQLISSFLSITPLGKVVYIKIFIIGTKEKENDGLPSKSEHTVWI